MVVSGEHLHVGSAGQRWQRWQREAAASWCLHTHTPSSPSLTPLHRSLNFLCLVPSSSSFLVLKMFDYGKQESVQKAKALCTEIRQLEDKIPRTKLKEILPQGKLPIMVLANKMDQMERQGSDSSGDMDANEAREAGRDMIYDMIRHDTAITLVGKHLLCFAFCAVLLPPPPRLR